MTQVRPASHGTHDFYDVVVIGAGILGLATARELLQRNPGIRLLVVDKEKSLAVHQTGHNSGVLHSGLYYQPGSMKALLCLSGKASLERYAEERGIPVHYCGKLVVAADHSELPALDELRRRGEANGVPGIEMLGPAGIKEIEPHAGGCAALWSPSTAIVDYRSVAAEMARDIGNAGAEIELGFEIISVAPRPEPFLAGCKDGDDCSASCGGLCRIAGRPVGEAHGLHSEGAHCSFPGRLLHAHRNGGRNGAWSHLPCPRSKVSLSRNPPHPHRRWSSPGGSKCSSCTPSGGIPSTRFQCP